MNLLISTVAVFLLISIVSLQHEFIAADSEPSIYNLFAAELLSAINENKSTQNIVYSPASIYNFLTALYRGSQDSTAAELHRALKLNQADNSSSRNPFKKRIVKFKKQLIIHNSIQSNDVLNKTNAIILNYIHLQTKWSRPFLRSQATQRFMMRNFFTAANTTTKLDFSKYVQTKSTEFPDLNATVFEMMFEQPHISMMIIRPNGASGLQTLENRLKDIDLNYISSRMRPDIVNVPPPKFRIELNIDLKGTLQKMGCVSLFENNATFNRFYEPLIRDRISNIQHKIYFAVSETGLYATGYTCNDCNDYDKVKGPLFRAKDPFIFFVRSKTEVFFAGHAANV